MTNRYDGTCVPTHDCLIRRHTHLIAILRKKAATPEEAEEAYNIAYITARDALKRVAEGEDAPWLVPSDPLVLRKKHHWVWLIHQAFAGWRQIKCSLVRGAKQTPVDLDQVYNSKNVTPLQLWIESEEAEVMHKYEEKLRAVLNQRTILSPTQQSYVDLHLWGLNQSRIGEITATSPPSVTRLKQRTLKVLKQQIVDN